MMDKLFDGSDAHLLPGNAELIQRLRECHDSDLEYGGFGVQEAVDAADALEAADKRIAELEAELQKRAKQIGVACMTHDLTHSLACGRCLTEAERKLAKLESENAAQLAELHAISAALGTSEGHSSVQHIEAMRENLAVAREAMEDLCDWDGDLVLKDFCEGVLAQIGGDE